MLHATLSFSIINREPQHSSRSTAPHARKNQAWRGACYPGQLAPASLKLIPLMASLMSICLLSEAISPGLIEAVDAGRGLPDRVQVIRGN